MMRFHLIIEALPNVNVAHALRALLKRLKRSDGWRCVSIREIPNSVADGIAPGVPGKPEKCDD